MAQKVGVNVREVRKHLGVDRGQKSLVLNGGENGAFLCEIVVEIRGIGGAFLKFFLDGIFEFLTSIRIR